MAKMKKELILTNEEIDALTKAENVLVKIVEVLDVDGDYLNKDIRYPDILKKIYLDIENCYE